MKSRIQVYFTSTRQQNSGKIFQLLWDFILYLTELSAAWSSQFVRKDGMAPILLHFAPV
jgi:hypothetical protein